MPDSRSELVLLIDAMARLHGRLREAFSSARAASALSDMEHTVLVAVVEAQRAPTVPQIGRSLGHPRQVIQRAPGVRHADLYSSRGSHTDTWKSTVPAISAM